MQQAAASERRRASGESSASHTADEILELITQLQTDRGTTVIIATHDPAVAAVAAKAHHTITVSGGAVD